MELADKEISSRRLRAEALAEFWHGFSRSRGAVIGLGVFLFFIAVAVFAPLIAPYAYDVRFDNAVLAPPVWSAGGSWAFPLGTDAIGRDMLSRLVYGAQYSLFVGLIVSGFVLVIGTIIGVVSGFVSGGADTLIMRLMDILLAFPALLLALILVNIVGRGLSGAIVATIIAFLPYFVRLSRAAVQAEKEKDYVTAARLAGAGRLRLMFKTILPNCMAPLIVQLTLAFSDAILSVAALGFLGMGAAAPTPEWGTMLADARDFVTTDKWWIVTMPGLAILILVLSINLAGDGLRDALDPKLKRS